MARKIRVVTEQGSVLGRNRGCGDIIMYGCMVPILLVVMVVGILLFITN